MVPGLQRSGRARSPKMVARYGAATTVVDWRGRLVCLRCGSRRIDMVGSGTKRRREWLEPSTPPLVNHSAGVVMPRAPSADILARWGLWRDEGRSVRALTTANPPLPFILNPGIAYRLPLQVPDRRDCCCYSANPALGKRAPIPRGNAGVPAGASLPFDRQNRRGLSGLPERPR
jgi:hypothetical protein